MVVGTLWTPYNELLLRKNEQLIFRIRIAEMCVCMEFMPFDLIYMFPKSFSYSESMDNEHLCRYEE